MFAIQERIQTFNHEAEDVQQVIERGSDEHLDILSKFTSSINGLTTKLEALNNDLAIDFNTMSADGIKECMSDLTDLYATSVKLKAAIRKSTLYRDAPNCCREFSSGVENLREIMYDLQNFRMQQDDLDDLMTQLNDL